MQIFTLPNNTHNDVAINHKGESFLLATKTTSHCVKNAPELRLPSLSSVCLYSFTQNLLKALLENLVSVATPQIDC